MNPSLFLGAITEHFPLLRLNLFVVQGVTGGVTSFPEFEKKFFPEVIGQHGGGQGVTYCQYDNQALQLFTSSLYLAGIFSTLVGGYTSRCSPQSGPC